MTRPARRATLALVPVFAVLFACGGGSDGGGGDPTPVVASVSVSPGLDTLGAAGATLQYVATARAADNEVIAGRAFTWTSSQTSVATISATGGMATAGSEGTTTIRASTEGVQGNATLVVKFPPPIGGTIKGTATLGSSFSVRAQKATRTAVAARTDRSAQASFSKQLPGPTHERPRWPTQRLQSVPESSVPGEWVVTFSSQVLAVPPIGSLAYRSGAATEGASAGIRASLARTVASGRARVDHLSPALLAARVRVTPGVPAAQVAAELRANPAVVAVEPNYIRRAVGSSRRLTTVVAPNDPLLPLQAWHYSMIDLPRAWQLTTGSASVLVAVVDDGIRFDHPGIAANLTDDGYDFVADGATIPICGGGSIPSSGDGDGYDGDPTNPLDVIIDPVQQCIAAVKASGNHGLHVAGTIGAQGNDGIGGSGVNWTVRIRPIRVIGLGGGTEYDIAQGILYAAGLPADNGLGGTVTAPSRAAVVNLSLGGPNPTAIGQNAVAAATAAGSLLIAAAGNHGTADPIYPAAYPEVLSVSAVGPDGVLASYSAFGATIDIAAPGGDLDDGNASYGVLSTAWNYQTNQPIYDNAAWNGTSMASPHVAGVAALILAANPGLTNSQVRSRLEIFAVDIGSPGVDAQYGHGMLNAYNALTQSFGPPRALKVFLYNATTGALIASVAAGAGGAYQFAGLAPGTYRVYAGEDEFADDVYGRALRRWGAFGGAATPTSIAVAGSSVTTANFTVGLPVELEDNGSIPNADALPVGGYLVGFFSSPFADVDVSRVDLATSGQYTFETEPLAGACGFGLEEDTILELLATNGTQLAANDDIDNPALNLCSRITMTLPAGTYYLRTSAYSGPGAPGLPNRRYSVSVRPGS